MPVTWNPSDIGANVALSNGNLTWLSTNSGGVCGRGTLGFLAGAGGVNATLKKYFEMTVNVSGSSALGFEMGFANANAVLSTYLGFSTNSKCYEASTGDVFYNSTVFGTFFTATTADVIGMALDFANQKVWWTKNGTTWNNAVIGSENPATNTGGATFGTAGVLQSSGVYQTVYPAFGSRQSGPGGTANFGATPFAFTPPSGFTAWEVDDSIVETATAVDTVSAQTVFNVSIVESATASDSASAARTFSDSVIEAATATDRVSYPPDVTTPVHLPVFTIT